MSDGVLLAHDLTDRGDPVADAAVRMAQQLGLPLSVLHVLTDEDLEQQRNARPPNAAFTDVVVAELQSQLRARVAQAAGGTESSPASVHVLIGDPHAVIVDHLEQHDYDFVFLGIRNRSRVGKLLFGSVAQSVLLRSPTKVVCVPTSD